MKCGHPDVMENLYWRKVKTRKMLLNLGGIWICRTCSLDRYYKYVATEKGKLSQHRYKTSDKGLATNRRFRESIAGILAETRHMIKRNAQMRGNR